MPRGLGVGSASRSVVAEPPSSLLGVRGFGYPPFCSLVVAPQTGLWCDLVTSLAKIEVATGQSPSFFLFFFFSFFFLFDF
jgi:hypothetical protein